MSDGKERVTTFEMAQLRLMAFSALKGWGTVREDGKWKAWSSEELKEVAERYANWAIHGHEYGCAFCGKSQEEVKMLVRGLGPCICNECIEEVAKIMPPVGEKTA